MAKKISKGHYVIKGYDIEKIKAEKYGAMNSEIFWNIVKDGIIIDSFSTKKECIEYIINTSDNEISSNKLRGVFMVSDYREKKVPHCVEILNDPKKGDKIVPQYFSNVCEIRANMTGKTGTGKVIAIACGTNHMAKDDLKAFQEYVEFLQKWTVQPESLRGKQ